MTNMMINTLIKNQSIKPLKLFDSAIAITNTFPFFQMQNGVV